MQDKNSVDSKAYIVQLIYRIPYLLLLAVMGAVLGSVIYLIIMFISTRTTEYEIQTRFYIDFKDEIIEAKASYNAYTWNDVLGLDEILGVMMEKIGDGYDREVIKSMMKAEILSDVRYLLVTITGDNPDDIVMIRSLLKEALENYGQNKKEFDSIYQIEEGKVEEIKVDFFTWRAAVLGAVAFFLFGLFVESLKFGIGGRFYTKSDITERLALEALGIEYKHSASVKFDSYEKKRQAEEHKKLVYNLEYLGYSLDNVMKLTLDYDFSSKGYGELKKYKGVVIAIPTDVYCVARITDILQNLKIQNINVVGAILTDVDIRWYHMYMFGLGRK